LILPFEKFLSTKSCKAYNAGAKEEDGGGFGDGIKTVASLVIFKASFNPVIYCIALRCVALNEGLL
jgi:hypothetical protein